MAQPAKLPLRARRASRTTSVNASSKPPVQDENAIVGGTQHQHQQNQNQHQQHQSSKPIVAQRQLGKSATLGSKFGGALSKSLGTAVTGKSTTTLHHDDPHSKATSRPLPPPRRALQDVNANGQPKRANDENRNSKDGGGLATVRPTAARSRSSSVAAPPNSNAATTTNGVTALASRLKISANDQQQQQSSSSTVAAPGTVRPISGLGASSKPTAATAAANRQQQAAFPTVASRSIAGPLSSQSNAREPAFKVHQDPAPALAPTTSTSRATTVSKSTRTRSRSVTERAYHAQAASNFLAVSEQQQQQVGPAAAAAPPVPPLPTDHRLSDGNVNVVPTSRVVSLVESKPAAPAAAPSNVVNNDGRDDVVAMEEDQGPIVSRPQSSLENVDDNKIEDDDDEDDDDEEIMMEVDGGDEFEQEFEIRQEDEEFNNNNMDALTVQPPLRTHSLNVHQSAEQQQQQYAPKPEGPLKRPRSTSSAIPPRSQLERDEDDEDWTRSNTQLDAHGVEQVTEIRSMFAEEHDFWDTTMVAEYSEEIFQYMTDMEEKSMPNPRYMDNQSEIEWDMRATLIDWLQQLHMRYHMVPETLWIAVNIVDRFLSSRVVSVSKIQLVGVTAMFIAAKYEEIMAPSVDEFAYVTEEGYTREAILKGERIVLSELDFDISPYCSPYTWVRRISKADDYDIQTRTLSKYLMEVTLLDHRFLRCKPSMVAAIGMYAARKMLGGPWDEAFVYYSGFATVQLELPFRFLVEVLADENFEKRFIFKKYASKKFLKAAIFVQSWCRGEAAEPYLRN